MDRGQLIAVSGKIYEYDRYDKYLKVHFATEVEIDDEGILTATYVPCCFSDEELANNQIDLTPPQLEGLVTHFIRQGYDLTDDEIGEVVEDILCRCFAVTGTPKFEELSDYIDEYMCR